MLTGIAERSNAIEECYEFMLAYAAQGLPSEEGSPSGGRLREFLDRDACDSLAAIELVLAQPAVSSQLIDNLNASIHLRALLTDLFLLAEIFKTQRNWAQRAVAAEGSSAIAADEAPRSTV